MDAIIRAVFSLLYPVLRIFIALFVFVRFCLYMISYRYTSSKVLSGKLVVINVENSELGIKAAKDLTARGATVILGVPDVARVKKSFESNPKAKVRELNTRDLESVRSFARRILDEESRVDILINNSGMFADEPGLTVDGFDGIHQSFYLAPFVLTETLLPLLKSSSPSRIINTGFFDYLYGSIETKVYEDVVRGRHNGSGYRLCDATLAIIMWTKALGAELKESGVTINVAHPGVVFALYETFKMNFGPLWKKMLRLFCGSSAGVGDDNLLFLCLDSTAAFENGKVFFNGQPKQTFAGDDSKVNREFLKLTRQLVKTARD